MILNNFYRYLSVFCRNTPIRKSSNSDPTATIPNLLNIVGENQNIYIYSAKSSEASSTANVSKNAPNYSLFYNLFMMVGTGTTTPNKTDYSLENRIFSSNDHVSINTNIQTDDGWKIHAVYNYYNNTENDVIITEAGIGKYLEIASSISENRHLFTRVLLDTPITVPSGESRPIVVDWDIY